MNTSAKGIFLIQMLVKSHAKLTQIKLK